MTHLVTNIRSHSDNGEQDYEWEECPKGGHLEFKWRPRGDRSEQTSSRTAGAITSIEALRQWEDVARVKARC